MFKRVIIKLSGEGLAGNSQEHFHDETINRIVLEVKQLVQKGVQISLVVGGGNFWRGRDAKPEMDKVKAHQIGMVGTLMNGLYLAEAFRLNGMKAVVMTPFAVSSFTELFTKESALNYMSSGAVTIFAGGTGHPFFSTDSIVAIRACELSVDAILYAKNIESVYDDDPAKNQKARRYRTVSYETVVAKNLSVADISAIDLTAKEKIPSVVFALAKSGSIIAACMDNDELFQIGGTKIDNHIEEEYYV